MAFQFRKEEPQEFTAMEQEKFRAKHARKRTGIKEKKMTIKELEKQWDKRHEKKESKVYNLINKKDREERSESLKKPIGEVQRLWDMNEKERDEYNKPKKNKGMSRKAMRFLASHK